MTHLARRKAPTLMDDMGELKAAVDASNARERWPASAASRAPRRRSTPNCGIARRCCGICSIDPELRRRTAALIERAERDG